jgi:hypothetical protein
MRRTEEPRGTSVTARVALAGAGVAFAMALPVYLAWALGVLDFERNSALTAALMGSVVIYVFTHPRAVEWVLAAVLGSAYSAVYFWRHGGFGGSYLAAAMICAAMLGLAGIITLGIQAILCEPIRRASRLSALIAAAFVPYLIIAMALALNMTTRVHPWTYDLYLYAFDQSLRVPVGAGAARLFSLAPPLAVATALVYQLLPLAMGVMIAVQRVRPRWFPLDLIKLLLISGVAGFLLYIAFPAAGPKYAFGEKFPGDLPSIEEVVVQPVPVRGAPPNAMPSLSLACVLLLWWNSRRLPAWGKAFTILSVALTVLATLGLGEHYVIDLVVALPFTVAMQAVALADAPMRSYLRWAPLAGGIALTAGWLAALGSAGSQFQTIWWLSWACVLATVLLCTVWKIMLDRAADRGVPQALNVTEFPTHPAGRATLTVISKR